MAVKKTGEKKKKDRKSVQSEKQKMKKAEARIDKQKLKKDIEAKAGQISEKDIEELLERNDTFEEKLKKIPDALARLLKQVKLLFEMIKDYRNGLYKEIPWYSLAMAVAAILYFINPIDIIPDFILVVGLVDDALVVGFVMKAIQEDLKKYCIFKGYALEEFF
jgi:uncharacterized membrane protein YkvA (DUF1232 family)